MLFVKILPNGRRGVYGFRWRRGRLHALCGDESDQRSRRGCLHQCIRCWVVAWIGWVFVWRLRLAAARGWLMGSAVSSSFDPDPRVARFGPTALLALGACAFAISFVCLGFAASSGAPKTTPPETSQAAKTPDKLVIDADELVYDKDKNTVSAVGSVQLFYQGRVLQADRVVYNRVTKRVYAEGHAKMTDEHGDVVYG